MKINNVELSDSEYATLKLWSDFAKDISLNGYKEYWELSRLSEKTVVNKVFNNKFSSDDYNDLRKLNLDEPASDPIKPKHYKDESGHDLFWHFKNGLLTHDEYVGFLKGNIFKYTKRYADKNGAEDLKKANEYQRELTEFEYGGLNN